MADETLSPQIPLVAPDGSVAPIPAEQVPDLINAGYTQPNQDQLNAFAQSQKYGTVGQQIKTGLEGALSAGTFGLGTKLEEGFGVNPSDIKARAEENPGSRMIGQGAGLLATNLIPGVGEAADASAAGDAASAASAINPLSAQSVMSGLGQRGATALGLDGSTALSKVGSMAVKGAIENAIFQGGDEVSKMFYGDPDAFTSTSLINVGLSGLLGGGLGAGIGAISPLWKATAGEKLGGYLDALKNRLDGNSIELPDGVRGALTDSGLQVSPEIKAGMSGVPEIDKQFNILREATTDPALNLQSKIKDFNMSADNGVMDALGKSGQTPTEVSNADVGNKLKDQLVDAVQSKFGPISDQYDRLAARLEYVTLTDADKSVIADQVAKAQQAEFGVSPSSPGYKLGNNIIKELKGLKTAEDVRKYKSIIGEATKDPTMLRAGKVYKGIFQGAQDDMLTASLQGEAPDVIAKAAQTNAQYGQARDVLENLNDRLHVGRWAGPTTFISALKDMTPEQVFSRLSKTNDSELMGLLGEHAPKALQTVKDAALDKMLYTARDGANGSLIDSKKLMKQLYAPNVSPEYRQFLLGDAEKKISAIQTLKDSLADYHSSDTPKHTEALWSLLPAGAMGMASALLGHGAIAGVALGQAGKWLIRDAPDATRLAMLKFLGSSGEVNSGAFKALVDFTHSAIKGESMLNNGVDGLFKAGKEVLPQMKMPTQKDRDKLINRVDELNKNPQGLFQTGGETGYYSPDHAKSMGQIAMKSVNFLNSIKPSTDKLGPLNSDRVPNDFENHEYQRALDVAQQPLMALHHIKEGTMVPQDLAVLHAIHPALQQRMSEKILNQVSEMQAKGEHVPYNLRMGLSMFLGQDLDASLSPQNIQMASQLTPGDSQQQMNQQKQKLRGGGKALTPMAAQNMTPLQARQQTKGTPA